ncbi:hypothetical protein CHLRE_17g711480v5 [Chlamydomonas reinhardtii]|uniref:Uncharacterized protein n=1 Tax=Chlamydomonas reinhardtii TaxID=3055 RepID=A0A2K3CPN4_CHLRE|nr:uncharacterized protein CHLRE_17g711480v5 [Chlamydomonas reinhardtii]PNW70237.1 hypothetical protein CHLRE_17g711480v5 [Chlamydomonas reinhardtii]
MRHALMEMLLGKPRPAALRPAGGGGGGAGPGDGVGGGGGTAPTGGNSSGHGVGPGGGGGTGGPGPSGSGGAHTCLEQRGRARPRGGGQRGAAFKAAPARRLRPAGVV